MKRLLVTSLVALLTASSAWAQPDYDKQFIYCPIGTLHYGKVVVPSLGRSLGQSALPPCQ
jgi:hypothetical protein